MERDSGQSAWAGSRDRCELRVSFAQHPEESFGFDRGQREESSLASEASWFAPGEDRIRLQFFVGEAALRLRHWLQAQRRFQWSIGVVLARDARERDDGLGGVDS